MPQVGYYSVYEGCEYNTQVVALVPLNISLMALPMWATTIAGHGASFYDGKCTPVVVPVVHETSG